MNITLEEAIEYLEDGEEITLKCDGYFYEISQSDNWVGGDVANGYISLVLGNVIYQSAENVIRKSIEHLSEDGKEVLITV